MRIGTRKGRLTPERRRAGVEVVISDKDAKTVKDGIPGPMSSSLPTKYEGPHVLSTLDGRRESEMMAGGCTSDILPYREEFGGFRQNYHDIMI